MNRYLLIEMIENVPRDPFLKHKTWIAPWVKHFCVTFLMRAKRFSSGSFYRLHSLGANKLVLRWVIAQRGSNAEISKEVSFYQVHHKNATPPTKVEIDQVLTKVFWAVARLIFRLLFHIVSLRERILLPIKSLICDLTLQGLDLGLDIK